MSELPSPTVHRDWISVTDVSHVSMPTGSRILHVAAGYLGVGPQAQPIIEVWYHADLDRPNVRREFRVVGTGHLADVDPSRHVGTVIHDLPGGRGVWHVFDEGESG